MFKGSCVTPVPLASPRKGSQLLLCMWLPGCSLTKCSLWKSGSVFTCTSALWPPVRIWSCKSGICIIKRPLEYYGDDSIPSTSVKLSLVPELISCLATGRNATYSKSIDIPYFLTCIFCWNSGSSMHCRVSKWNYPDTLFFLISWCWVFYLQIFQKLVFVSQHESK